MTKDTLAEAMRDAERFLRLAQEMMVEFETNNSEWLIVGTALSGKTRRASMDLTRSLADMRRP